MKEYCPQCESGSRDVRGYVNSSPRDEEWCCLNKWHEHADHWRAGFIVRLSSMWVGIHWSNTNRRLCINFLPCFTFFVTLANGDLPKLSDYPRRWMIRK